MEKDLRRPWRFCAWSSITLWLLLVGMSPIANVQEAISAPSWPSDWQWLGGDCESGPRVETHQIDDSTFLLRQPLCVSFEAPVMVLLIGADRAVLLDSGASADASDALVGQVVRLLPAPGGRRLPLVVAHTHGHLDHRSGDEAFRRLDNTTVVGSGVEDVASFWGIRSWPDGFARLNLGGRILEVVAVPGHHPSSIAIFDERTGLLISGDSLLPGRVIINDLSAFRASARRLAEFAASRSVAWVVGAHVEMDGAGSLYRAGAGAHPDERPAALPAASVVELQVAMDGFGAMAIRSRHTDFVLVRYRLLLVLAGVGVVVVGIGRAGRRWRGRGRRGATS